MARNQLKSEIIEYTFLKIFRLQRGAVTPLVGVCLVMMLGFGALTIDSGRLYVAKNELQNAADAAALAAATAMLSQANQISDTASVTQQGYVLANGISQKNQCRGTNVSLLQANVTFGRLEHPTNLTDPFQAGATIHNADKVIAQRNAASNGLLSLTLARIWGMKTTSVSATAVAILDDHVAGYRPLDSVPNTAGGPLIPLTLSASSFNSQLATGSDQFGYDGSHISTGSDGIREIHLYPESDANGNCGLLNIGTSNQSQGAVETQIQNGVTKADLTTEVGQPELIFTTDSGQAHTYQITGTSGLKASLQTVLQSRIGQVVGFPIHNSSVASGANTTFTIVGIRYGRVMEVTLNGNNKRVVIQPVFYTGSEVVTNPAAPSTDNYVSRIHLAR